MAKRRMFNESVVESDAFLSMPISSQALYFHIGMRADDEGFCGSTNSIMRIVGASDGDMKKLIEMGFIIEFPSKIKVVKHWRINNYLQNDRVTPTQYEDEKKMLYLKKNRSYTLDPSQGEPLISMDKKCIQNVSIDKNRLVENRLDKNSSLEDRVVGEGATVQTNMEFLKEKRIKMGYTPKDDDLF